MYDEGEQCSWWLARLIMRAFVFLPQFVCVSDPNYSRVALQAASTGPIYDVCKPRKKPMEKGDGGRNTASRFEARGHRCAYAWPKASLEVHAYFILWGSVHGDLCLEYSITVSFRTNNWDPNSFGLSNNIYSCQMMLLPLKCLMLRSFIIGSRSKFRQDAVLFFF
jgi:hypothetical protein